MKRIVLVAVLFFSLLFSSHYLFAFEDKASLNKIHITLVSPNTNDQDFWGDVHNFARASARSLDIKFNVLYNASHHGITYVEQIEQLLSATNKPDAIIAVSYRQQTQKIMRLSQKYNVPVFMINNELPQETKDKIGLPRTTYKTYLGHISANDYVLSEQLSTFLISKAKQAHPNQIINVVGISGSRAAPETYNRNLALSDVVTRDASSKLYQILHADWLAATASRQASAVFKRYKDINVMWYASDHMALSANRTLTQQHEREVVSGGFDWTKQAIIAIKEGHLDASVGGHFTDGGFALVLLYDYFNGKDFSHVYPLLTYSSGGVIHQGNVDQYYQLLTKKKWSSIDFKKYSRVHNPKLLTYDFSIQSLLEH